MWAELFIVGTFWFWALIVCEGIWLFGFTKYEKGWSSAGSLIVTALLLCFFGNVNVFSWIWSNPLMTLYYVIGYFVIGAAWSLIKWRFVCGDVRDKYLEVRDDFFGEHKLIAGQPISPELQTRWISRVRGVNWSGYLPVETADWRRREINSIKDIIPKAKDYKSCVLFWIGYWPLSAFWFFLSDLLERLITGIYNFLSGLLQRIANATFAGIPDDIKQSATDTDGRRN
jgi:hypothetical protein